MESCAQESERFGRPLCAGLPKWSQGRPNQLAHLGRARLSGRARIPPAGQPAQLNSTRLGSSPTIGQTSWRQARGWRALVASGARAGGRGRRLRAEQEATRPPHRKASGGGANAGRSSAPATAAAWPAGGRAPKGRLLLAPAPPRPPARTAPPASGRRRKHLRPGRASQPVGQSVSKRRPRLSVSSKLASAHVNLK